MQQRIRTRKRNSFSGAIAVLLLAAITGCGGGGNGGGGGGGTPNTPPSIMEGSQSALHVQAQRTASFRVSARDAESTTLRFSWEASAGTVGTANDTGTSSAMTWTAPGCAERGNGTATVTATVRDEQGGSASKSFTVSLERCHTGARAIAIATGMQYSLALLSDGAVLAWGQNMYGQLGEGTNTLSATATEVSGLTGVTALSAGTFHALALGQDGTVQAWGFNTSNQLGDGTSSRNPTPGPVLLP